MTLDSPSVSPRSRFPSWAIGLLAVLIAHVMLIHVALQWAFTMPIPVNNRDASAILGLLIAVGLQWAAWRQLRLVRQPDLA